MMLEPNSEELAIYVVGLADNELKQRIEYFADRDFDIASQIQLMRDVSFGSMPASTDGFAAVTALTDADLLEKIRLAKSVGDEDGLAAGFEEVLLRYGSEAKSLIRRGLPSCNSDQMLTILEHGLADTASFLCDCDDNDETIHGVFISGVIKFVVANIAKAAEAQYKKCLSELNELREVNAQMIAQGERFQTRRERKKPSIDSGSK